MNPILKRLAFSLPVLYLLGLLALLYAADTLFLNAHTFAIGINVGAWDDRVLLDGVYARETDPQGTDYRWTRGSTTITFDTIASLPGAILDISAGGAPPSAPLPRMLSTVLNQQPLANLPIDGTPRRYRLLAPPAALGGHLVLNLNSETTQLPSDDRTLGARLDRVYLRPLATGLVLPFWPALACQFGIVLCAVLITWRLGFGRTPSAIIGLVFCAVTLWMGQQQPVFALIWLERVLICSFLLLLVLWNAPRWIARLLPFASDKRQVRWLGALLALSVGLRLLAILYPAFYSHDLYIHDRRLTDLQLGDIRIYDRPAEFRDRLAIVPPAMYLIVAPLTVLSTDPDAGMHAFYALWDGSMPFIFALALSWLGIRRRAVRIAALILSALPIQLSVPWWGFGPQILGQWLLLVMLWLIVQRRFTGNCFWALALAVGGMLFLTHNSIIGLGGVALGGYFAWQWLRQPEQRPTILRWAVVGIAGALFAFGTLYLDMLRVTSADMHNRDSALFADWVWVQWASNALNDSFRPIGVVVSGIALTTALAWLRNGQRILLACWVGSALLFFAIDLAFKLQVRYAYFLIPMICLSLGLLLDYLARRGGRWVVIGVVGQVLVVGTWLWYSGMLYAIKPPLYALTH